MPAFRRSGTGSDVWLDRGVHISFLRICLQGTIEGKVVQFVWRVGDSAVEGQLTPCIFRYDLVKIAIPGSGTDPSGRWQPTYGP